MKVAIMQPYFFPYVGYYSLIKHSDEFILFDPVQFIRHGWIERNRILKPNEGWQYVQVPLVKHPRETLIKEVEINNKEVWKEKLIAQLQHYKKRSPYYTNCIELVKECLSIQTNSIVKLNEHILKLTCEYLGIMFNCKIFSEMDLKIDEVKAADEWALNISKAIGATEYINPPRGKEFFDKTKYDEGNINLVFLTNDIQPYNQNRPNFEAGLSIIDLIMFNDQSAINKLIDNIKYS